MSDVALKIDVDTHEGMRDGVPRLLEALREARVRASIFLSFGPDNSGKAVWNVLRQKGFLRKMLRTGAPSLYGWRTLVSGTLLPARPIADAFPDLVRRLAGEGHEVGVHAWDHRLWQDHLGELDEATIAAQFARAFESYERILGERPRAVAAPAWLASPASLRVQDTLGLLYASDMRGGPPCFPRLQGYRSTTLQIPTTQACLEELLTLGRGETDDCVARVLRRPGDGVPRVLALHAEVEGGRHHDFLHTVLRSLMCEAARIVPLEELARRRLRERATIPVLETTLAPLPGRAGVVFTPAAAAACSA